MMPGVNYVIYGCSSAGTTLGIWLPETNTWGEYCSSYYSTQGDRWQFKMVN